MSTFKRQDSLYWCEQEQVVTQVQEGTRECNGVIRAQSCSAWRGEAVPKALPEGIAVRAPGRTRTLSDLHKHATDAHTHPALQQNKEGKDSKLRSPPHEDA
jgi:hypothetical protein